MRFEVLSEDNQEDKLFRKHLRKIIKIHSSKTIFKKKYDDLINIGLI